MQLSAYLESRQITQKAFAEQLGVTQGLVWQWITGRTRIKAERARQIERATDGAVQAHELRPDLFDPPADRAA